MGNFEPSVRIIDLSQIRNFEAKLVVVVEINFALWIMIACLAIKASELIPALS